MKEKLKLKNGNILYIFQDEYPESPREWDNLGTMICFHRRYSLGDDKESKKYQGTEELFSELAGCNADDEEFEGKEDKEVWQIIKERAHKNAIILPLALYDHSGLTMWVGSKASSFDPGGWDSGQIGWIYVTREKLKQEALADKTDAEIETYLENEVKQYDQYLTGDVYGFKLVKEVTNTWVSKETGEERTETEEEELDSCHGFYGSNHGENGLYDHAGIKAEDILEEVTV